MNRFMEERWSWIEGSHGMRAGLLEHLTNADLTFSPGGQAMTLGALFREIGDIEYSYLQSLKTFKQDLSYRNPEAGLETSIARLNAWYTALDAEFMEVVSAFTDDDLKKNVERGSGFSMPVEMQLDVYLQALLISFGKVTIYFKAMSKPLPPSVQEYIW